jgi:hypothetical protein
MRTLSDIQERILKEEFPNTNFESDSDVERYFELRHNGRQGEALGLYNNRLRRKYPDDAQRTLLLKFYRSHDPRYRLVYMQSLALLADRLLVRTKKIIEVLTKDIDTIKMTDAYAVIKLAEGLLSVISPDRYVAISFTDKYVRYARILDYRYTQMERTAELIRLYVTDTIESVQDFKRENEERKKERLRSQERQRTRHPTFDLSKIVFSKADIARITIPQTILRTEDIVVSYCLRYWNLVNDQAFEKTIFLYSRKYKTNHNDIFQAIKNGRQHGWRDEEILNAVLANVVTGYYYSISGDIYLQRIWARYKAAYQLGPQESPSAALALAPVGPERSKGATTRRSVAPVQSRSTISVVTQNRRPRTIPLSGNDRPKAPSKTAPIRQAAEARETAPIKPKTVTPFKPRKETRREKPVLPATPAFVPNSIADIIRKMTGKTYTVYKDLFFKGIRTSIRAILATSSTRRGTLFDGKQNDAEQIVYQFLFDHYNDPYQNWKGCEERAKVEGLGYAMPELEPIIARWIKDSK